MLYSGNKSYDLKIFSDQWSEMVGLKRCGEGGGLYGQFL